MEGYSRACREKWIEATEGRGKGGSERKDGKNVDGGEERDRRDGERK